MKIILLLLFPFLMAIGQIFFKKTALTLSNSSSGYPFGYFEGFFKALQIPWLYFAIITYFLATLTWLYILQRVSLSIAYPFAALAMVIVPIASYLLFQEKLSLQYWIGLFLIVTGITVIAK